jgi:hypothetical protein
MLLLHLGPLWSEHLPRCAVMKCLLPLSPLDCEHPEDREAVLPTFQPMVQAQQVPQKLMDEDQIPMPNSYLCPHDA